ncbi:MAG: exodeoxyribonuclease VII large subunit [Gemmatimonadaceae bacterium]|nr:exodeoxyribonuclease VII large subunit [Chitinophagaceae bacterium]
MTDRVDHLRLSELNRKIAVAIDAAFRSMTYWVVADVTNHTYREQKNYHSFELVEKGSDTSDIVARISAKAWGKGASRILEFEKLTGQVFTNNIHVLLNVAVIFHPKYGLQLDIIDIDPAFTLGALEQQRMATLARLVAENDFIQKSGDQYITRNNLLRLPAVIQRVALISSATSAGAEDFRHSLLNNSYGFDFRVDDYYTTVQGESNAKQFRDKIVEVYKSGIVYDVLVIIRGGGAQSDFLLFDNYGIGQAIAKFPLPVITGIGHQKNETIADLMAHTPLKTPTKVAEFIIAHNKAFEERIRNIQKNILIKSQQLFSSRTRQINAINSQLVNNSRDILFLRKTALSNLKANIKTSNFHFVRNAAGSLSHYASLVKMMAPQNILRKGFAIVKMDGQIQTNADGMEAGSRIAINFADTTVLSEVINKTKHDGSEYDI